MRTSTTFGRQVDKEAEIEREKDDKKRKSRESDKEWAKLSEGQTKGQRRRDAILIVIFLGGIGFGIGVWIASSIEDVSFSVIARWSVPICTVIGIVLALIINFFAHIKPYLSSNKEYEHSDADARENAKGEPEPETLVAVGDYMIPLVTPQAPTQSQWQDKTLPYDTRPRQSRVTEIKAANKAVDTMNTQLFGNVLPVIGFYHQNKHRYEIPPKDLRKITGVVTSIQEIKLKKAKGKSKYITSEVHFEADHKRKDCMISNFIIDNTIHYTDGKAIGREYNVGDKVLIQYDITNPYNFNIID